MAHRKLLAAVSLAAIGAVGVGGAAAANAAGGTSSTSSATNSTSTQDGQTGKDGKDGKGGHEHAAVTGTEATNVKNAVTAKYSGITITEVRKDPDGTYDVLATKSGNRVMYEVSKDLKTISERTGGGPRGDHGGRGGKGGPGGKGHHAHTAVTGTEATNVKNAVTAKYSGITVTEVRKDPDGSYDVLATKSGNRVMYEVSKDLKTISERTGGGPRGDKGPDAPAPNASSSATAGASA
ncbi:hypothetical protein [Yimella sp. cx-51]|uniref:hypothetical protein n=1 Tax=Yimella sp. cx-51 TaxID=2770551 RepID=UPI00165D678C|nr:hypothetical protein [Yimella sp. cx-51]MBC9956848.1 hypothetical protein [Yimella sp. cx-51]QTH39074.1 hypothetical protein J5M86_05475 [Yimella sp. cx-51]